MHVETVSRERSDQVSAAVAWDVEAFRADFPQLAVRARGERPLVYLDNAATTHKPRSVIDAVRGFYERKNANIHRGVHWLSQQATEAYEAAREAVARWIGASSAREIVFTRGTTESINLVAQTFGRSRLEPGDEVLITEMEHHSNIVPWQMVCAERGARLVVAPVTDEGELDLEAFRARLGPRTKLVAAVHVSNSLGTINPVEEIVRAARQWQVPVLIDGAQAMAHQRVDVQALGCDFYAFSGHKMFGPTGVGVLYGRAEHLEAMPPYQGGGDMISRVTFEKTTYNDIPFKFEAGTPNIAGVLGLGAAVRYLEGLDLAALCRHEAALLQRAEEGLGAFPGLRLVGRARRKSAVVSFVLDDVHAHDVGTILDHEGVAVRTGHHCTQPLMQRFGVPSTVRASFAGYTTLGEVDAFVAALHRVREVFS